MLVEKLRKGAGFVGRIVYDEDGTKYVQITRSPAVGVIVCTGLDKDEPIIGWALISPDEDIIDWKGAEKLAELRANKEVTSGPNIPTYLNAQVKHFKERCKSYYNPKKFSKKDKKREGSELKVWINDSDKTFNTNLVK